jgi:hypothetical protein
MYLMIMIILTKLDFKSLFIFKWKSDLQAEYVNAYSHGSIAELNTGITSVSATDITQDDVDVLAGYLCSVYLNPAELFAELLSRPIRKVVKVFGGFRNKYGLILNGSRKERSICKAI